MVIRRRSEKKWQPGGNLISRLKLWVCQRSLDPENFTKTCPRRVFFIFFFLPCLLLTLSGVLIGFWLIHADVRTCTSAHFTRCLIWLAMWWHPAASNEARCRRRRTWGQRGNYNSAGFHLVLGSTTPPVFEPRLKTFKTRQRKEEEGWKRKKKKSLSCQNSMSLYLKRELVIGHECRGEGDWRHEGTWSRVLQLLRYAAHIIYSPRQREACSAAREP